MCPALGQDFATGSMLACPGLPNGVSIGWLRCGPACQILCDNVVFARVQDLLTGDRLHKQGFIFILCFFRFDVSDLPLLLAVAGTHTPHLAMALQC